MKKNNLVFVLALVTALLAFANVMVMINQEEAFGKLTGHASQKTGKANLTVSSTVSINFTDDIIDWGVGTHDSGVSNATLISNGTIINGNWTAESSGLVIENNGNVNATLEIRAGSDAAGFIGGTSPAYEWRYEEKETDSCVNIQDTSFTAVNTSDETICDPLKFGSTEDELRMDIKVVVPDDTPKNTKEDTITATATAA